MSERKFLKLFVKLKEKFRCSACKSFIKEGNVLNCGDQICKHCYKKNVCPKCNKKVQISESNEMFQNTIGFINNFSDQVDECWNALTLKDDEEEDYINCSEIINDTEISREGFDSGLHAKNNAIMEWLNNEYNKFVGASSQTDPSGFEVATAQTDFREFEMDADNVLPSPSSSCKDQINELSPTRHKRQQLSSLSSSTLDNESSENSNFILDTEIADELENEILDKYDNEFEQMQKEGHTAAELNKTVERSKNVDAGVGGSDRANDESAKLKISPEFRGWDNKLWKCVEKKMNRTKLNIRIDKELMGKKWTPGSQKLTETLIPNSKKSAVDKDEVITIDSASEIDIHERITPIYKLPSEFCETMPTQISQNPVIYFQPSKISTIIEEEGSDDIGDGKENAIKSICNNLKDYFENLDDKKVLVHNLDRIKKFLNSLQNQSKLVDKSVQTTANIFNISAQTDEKTCTDAFVQTNFENDLQEEQVQTEKSTVATDKAIETIAKKMTSSGMQTINRQIAATQYVDVSRLLADPFLKETVLNEEIESALCAIGSLNLNIKNKQKFIGNYKQLIQSNSVKKMSRQVSSDIVQLTEEDGFSLSSLTSTENRLLAAMQEAEERSHSTTEVVACQTTSKLIHAEKDTQTNLKVDFGCQNNVSSENVTSTSTSSTMSNCQMAKAESTSQIRRKSKFTTQNAQLDKTSCRINQSTTNLEDKSPLRMRQIEGGSSLPAKHSHTNLKTLYTLRNGQNSRLSSPTNDKENVLQKLTSGFLEFESQVKLAKEKSLLINSYSQQDNIIDNVLSTPFLDDDFDTQAIIANAKMSKSCLDVEHNSGDAKNNPVTVDEFETTSKESNSIRRAEQCLQQFKQYKRIRPPEDNDSDVEQMPQKKSCPNLIRDDLSVEFDSNQMDNSLGNCDYDMELDKILKNYDENNGSNPLRKSSQNSDRTSSHTSRPPVREYSKEMSAADLRKLSPIKRCHDILEKTNKIIRDGKLMSEEKSSYFEIDGIEPLQKNTTKDGGATVNDIKSLPSGSDIIFETEKLIEDAKQRKVGITEKMSESLFSPTGQSNSFCLSRKTSVQALTTEPSPFCDGLDDLMNKEADILSANAVQSPQSKKSPTKNKINILDNSLVRQSDVDAFLISDSDEELIVDTTPQKPLRNIEKLSKNVNKEQDGNLTETLEDLPEELDVTAIEQDVSNNELLSLTAIENCVSVNKMDSILNKSELSPIRKSSQSGRTFIEMAHNSKYNPLVVIKTKPTSSQVILTSTPRQKSIRNYLTDINTLSQPRVLKTCVIASRLSNNQIVQIMELEKKGLVQYSANFDPKITTHLVIKPDERNCIMELTLKMLWAITCGIWVVKFDWVQECLQKNCIVNEEPFEVLDMNGGFGPKTSRLSKNSRTLFKGYAFYLTKVMYEDDLKSIVRHLKGEIINSLTDLKKFRNSYYCMIITNSDNKNETELYETWRKTHKVLVVDQEWLSNSIMFYKIINVRKHLLCSPYGIETLGYLPDLVAEIMDISNITITNT